MLLKKGMRIVFAGDSVTDDSRSRPEGEGRGNSLGLGYVHMTDAMLTVDYPELFIRCTNRGIGGNTSRDLLARWEEDVTALKPDLVVLCIGINDVWRQFDCTVQTDWAVSPEEYRRNLNVMADHTTVPMVWMTPYYLEPNPATSWNPTETTPCGPGWTNTGPSARRKPPNGASLASTCRRPLPPCCATAIPPPSPGIGSTPASPAAWSSPVP